jgi:hypothetical protein
MLIEQRQHRLQDVLQPIKERLQVHGRTERGQLCSGTYER